MTKRVNQKDRLLRFRAAFVPVTAALAPIADLASLLEALSRVASRVARPLEIAIAPCFKAAAISTMSSVIASCSASWSRNLQAKTCVLANSSSGFKPPTHSKFVVCVHHHKCSLDKYICDNAHILRWIASLIALRNSTAHEKSALILRAFI